MSDNTNIEWADATWSPTLGCTRVSPGCDGCYAIRTVHRMAHNPNPKVSAVASGLTEHRDGRLDWTGEVNSLPDRLDLPLRWRKPRRIFVDSQSDLFHERISDEFIARVFAVMAATPRHTYQVLTKRPGRMRSLLSRDEFRLLTKAAHHEMQLSGVVSYRPLVINVWPLPNVWLGVSVEDQKWADIRIPALLDTPAAVRFLSCEPLLGPIHLTPWLHDSTCVLDSEFVCTCYEPREVGIDWIIVGGESGPEFREMYATWARSLRNQAQAAGVPFLFKQWGGIRPKAGGRELDGRTWDQFPEVAR